MQTTLIESSTVLDIEKMDSNSQMYVIKRNGEKQELLFDNITRRNQKLANDLNIDTTSLSLSVIQGLKSGMTTREIDFLSCENAIYKSTYEPNYAILAARIAINDLHKTTPKTFHECIKKLYMNVNKINNLSNPLIDGQVYNFALEHIEEIEKAIKHDNDYNYTYFGFKTLEKSYLQKVDGVIVERPQYMLMRVALGIHGPSDRNGFLHKGDIGLVLQTYRELSSMKFTHATPTLFYSGTPKPQMSSCFLLNCPDSINGITDCWKTCSFISKHAGGIGVDLTVRSKGSYISGTNGHSNGIIPLIKVFNEIARYVDQCFVPGTLVYTENGPKPIEDVGVNDKVLTSEGIYYNVKQPVRHEYNGKMLDIQIKNSIVPVRVTPDHQIMALKGQDKGTNYEIIKHRLDKKLCNIEFYDAKELNKGDFLVYTIPTYEKDIKFISEDDCRMYGIMLGDGYISQTVSGIACNVNTKKETIDFVRKYLTDRAVKFNEYTEENCLKLKWSTASIGFKFTKTQLYDNFKNKHIETTMLHLPKNKILNIIKGLIETDGCVSEKEISIENTSESIIEGLRYMLLRLGALSSGYLRNRVGNVSKYKNITTRKTTSVLRVPRIKEIMELFPDAPEGKFFSFLRYNDKLLSRIESIVETNYEGIVHDFEIDGPHDYTLSHLGIVHNGGGKRKGAISLYLQPWHPDILEFLEIRVNTGPEEARARDVFPALWIPDLFFKRLQQPNSKWSLFCPGKYPELVTLYGEEFEKRYIELEQQKEYLTQIPIEELWKKIMKSLEETGLPYMMSKDNVNNKSNHKNIGPITGSNLCTEIVQYHDSKSTAVCNLASICLPMFVKEDGSYDFEELGKIVEIIVHNMNNIIDKNYYPEYEIDCFDDDEYDGKTKPKKVIGRNNNLKYRPIGIGVQGLADVFAKMKLSWDSQDARVLNQVIFETIYYHALKKSYNISRFDYGPYSKFQGSPVSQGILQYDMWNITPYTQTHSLNTTINIPKFNWNMLKSEIKQYGVRNSLMVAPMPTASTSQIMGNTEAFEPLTSNLYIRKVGAGDFPIVNTHLYKDLKQLGLWKKELVDEIIMNNGSVQNIQLIPDNIKKLYKTVWEIPQKIIVDFAADRGAFIDQTQSLNIFMERPTVSKLSSLYMYGWKRGLKTLSYYLRTQPATGAVKFTVMNENVNKPNENKNEKTEGLTQDKDTVYKINKYTGQKFICTEEVCTACSS